MRIALGADHRGTEVCSHLAQVLQLQGHSLRLFHGCDHQPCDYPDQAYAVGHSVVCGESERGILICGSGIGMSIAANKLTGVRAALIHDEISAEISRRHNDANVLCLPADMLGLRIIDRIVQTWLHTEFEGGRHMRRVEKIIAIESGHDPRLVSQTTHPKSIPAA